MIIGVRLLLLKFDKDKITKLSSEIFNSLEKLNELSLLSKEDFLSDPYKVASAKYFFIVSIEAAIDMCNHLISKNRFRVPEDYADTFKVMGEIGAFSSGFVDRLRDMAKFRNRLVHIYWEVDNEVVFELLQEDIKDIGEFVDIFMKFLSKKVDKSI